MTVGGKTLREHFEVINHRDAIEFVESLVSSDAPVSAHIVRQLHALVLARIDADEAGQYRRMQLGIGGARHRPPDAFDVPIRMTEWEQWLYVGVQGLHAVERAAMAHRRFVAIHPFADGNGCTGRLLMNLLLMRDGYPPAVIERINRTQYCRVLAAADAGEPTGLVNFVARAVERSLTLYVQAVLPYDQPSTLREPQPVYAVTRSAWVALADAARGTPYSQEYLSLLARKGQLDAMKHGRNWRTTHAAVKAYRQSVEKPG